MFASNASSHQHSTTPDSCRLKSLDDLPPCFRTVYQGAFRYFNPIQSESFTEIFGSDMNIVLAAPTGGGKTVCLELAILRLLCRHVDAASGQFQHRPGLLKSVYLAPAKALVQEKVREWRERFGGALGLTVKEVTGDTDRDELASLDTADIICTTPEKFDSMTRRHRNRGGMRFFNEIALVLIDEVHLLNEDRGSSLEAGVISRIKLVSCMPQMRGQPICSVRYLAVSATVPNIRDLAEWLGAPAHGIKVFGEEMRPVPLRTVVRGYSKTSNDFLFDRRLTDNVYAVLEEFSRGKPALVFCPSRAGVSSTGAAVAKEAARKAGGSRPSMLLRDPAHQQRLAAAAAGLKDATLRECVLAGVGLHHAAMEPSDRTTVEALFRAQDLLVLCTTSTLAVGVNLPAFLVVIKGTRRYAGAEASDPGGYQEYERSSCLQMVGRAGRPQFDTEGCAVIMTESVSRYQQLVTGAEPVESTLQSALPEFLNAEIALGTVGDVSTAIAWLKTTYFYVRVRRNPAPYKVPAALHRDPAALERWMREALVLTTMRELAKLALVRTDEDGFALEPLQAGIIMAENYVRLPTMAIICGCPPVAGMAELLWAVARSAELSGIKLRRTEKKALNAVNKSKGVRFHVMSAARPDRVADRISTAADKVFVLLNYALADSPGDKLEYSLRQDAEQAVAVGARLAAAMVRYFSHTERASEAFNALLLQKSLKQRMWTGSATETRQVPGLGPITAERLAAAGVHSLRKLQGVDPRKLESMAQRPFPWGSEVADALQRRLSPALTLECSPLSWAPGGKLDLQITLTRSADGGSGGGNNPAPSGGGAEGTRSAARLLVGTLHDNALLACRSVCLETFPSPLTFRLRTRSLAGPRGSGSGGPTQVVASVVHERLVGLDMAVKTVVPHSANLNGQHAPPAPTVDAATPAAATSAGQSALSDTPSADDQGAAPATSPPRQGRQQTLQESLKSRARKQARPAPAGVAVEDGGSAAKPAAAPAGMQPIDEAQGYMQRKLQLAKPATVAAALSAAAPQAIPPALAPPKAATAPGSGGKWTSFARSVPTGRAVGAVPAGPSAVPRPGAWSDASIQRAAAAGSLQEKAARTEQPPLRQVPHRAPPPPQSMRAAADMAGEAKPFAQFAFGLRAPAPPGRVPAMPMPTAQPLVALASPTASKRAAEAVKPLASSAPPVPERAKRIKLPSFAWLTVKYAAPDSDKTQAAAPAVSPLPRPPALPDLSQAFSFL